MNPLTTQNGPRPVTEYPHGQYQRDPLHIADALDQIRRRLGKHKIEAPPGTTALPEVPTAFDLGFLTSRLAEVVAFSGR